MCLKIRSTEISVLTQYIPSKYTYTSIYNEEQVYFYERNIIKFKRDEKTPPYKEIASIQHKWKDVSYAHNGY